MKCDICGLVMDEDITSYYDTHRELGGHIACMRVYLASLALVEEVERHKHKHSERITYYTETESYNNDNVA